MIIAIDYDDTFTRDTVLWRNFIELARNLGHEVICVTNRSTPPSQGKEQDLLPEDVQIVCADNRFKRVAALQAGYQIDIWIDDNPGSIGQSNKLIW